MIGKPSWSVKAFGEDAPALAKAILEALREAHSCALAAHLAGGLDSNDTYGTTLALKQHDELVRHLAGTGIEGVGSLRVRRFHLSTVGNVVFYPVRYADAAKTAATAKPLRKPVSELRRTLFSLHGPTPAQSSVYEELAEGERGTYTLENALSLGLAEDTKLVTLAYAASPSAGVLKLHWGEAELTQDAYLSWQDQQYEEIPLLLDAGVASPPGLRAVPDTLGTRSFKQGVPPEIDLGMRAEPEQEATGDETQ